MEPVSATAARWGGILRLGGRARSGKEGDSAGTQPAGAPHGGAVVTLRAASAGGRCGAGQGRAGQGWRRRAPLPSQRRRLHVAATATPQPRRWGQERDWGRERERGCPGWQRPFRVPRGDTAHTSPCPLASPQAQGAAPQGGHYLSPLPCPSAGSAIWAREVYFWSQLFDYSFLIASGRYFCPSC